MSLVTLLNIPVYNFKHKNVEIYYNSKCYFTGFKKAGVYVLLKYTEGEWKIYNCKRRENEYNQFNLYDELIDITDKLNTKNIYQCYLYHSKGNFKQFIYPEKSNYKLRIIDIIDNNLTFSQRVDELNILSNTINNKYIKISKYATSYNNDEFFKIDYIMKNYYLFHHIIITSTYMPIHLKFKNF